MKKSVFLTGFATVAMLTASAQNRRSVPPPPPPPKPPVEATKDIPPPPAPQQPDEPPPPPAAPEMQEDFNAFMKRNPSIKAVHWRNDEIIIGLKSGKEERYNLTDEKSLKSAEARYGALPEAPPPPPPPPPPAKRKARTLS